MKVMLFLWFGMLEMLRECDETVGFVLFLLNGFCGIFLTGYFMVLFGGSDLGFIEKWKRRRRRNLVKKMMGVYGLE